jgi:AraC-like DNA-binding protein
MDKTILHVKNMVCPRCILTVKNILDDLNISYKEVNLGEIILKEGEKIEMGILDKKLTELGFEIIEDKKARLVEKVKTTIVKLVQQYSTWDTKINFSDYISREVGKDYTYLSNLFSEMENITIEKYLIQQRIEKVKELLTYNEYTLSEIAYQLHYSSVAHLSGQFKQVTGFTPSRFRKLKSRSRKGLDSL